MLLSGSLSLWLYYPPIVSSGTFSRQPDSIVEAYEEMHVRGTVILPEVYLSAVLKLCFSRRGKLLSQDCLDETRLHLAFDFPLSEIIFDFNDKLKNVSSGFAR